MGTVIATYASQPDGPLKGAGGYIYIYIYIYVRFENNGEPNTSK